MLILTQVGQGDNRLWLLWREFQNREFYLVVILAASEPDLYKKYNNNTYYWPTSPIHTASQSFSTTELGHHVGEKYNRFDACHSLCITHLELPSCFF